MVLVSQTVLTLLEIIAFPAAIAIGLSVLTVREANRELRRLKSPILVESDLMNENLDPSIHSLNYLLFFALYFNLIYLTVNLKIVESTLFDSPYVYAACIAAFMIALFLAFSFVFRFNERKYAIIGIVFAIAATVVVVTAIQLGFGHWVAYGSTGSTGSTGSSGSSGSSGSTGMTLTGQAQAYLIPIVIATCAWTLAVISMLIDFGYIPRHLPIRFPSASAYNLLLSALILGWIGVMLAIFHPLMTLF
jgi:Kef-type K+ transport system membrane component KefB